MPQHRAGQAILGHAMPNSQGTNAIGQNRCGMWKRTRIITHGYVGGGYQNSSPWRNVNRTNHSTDATTDLGDKMSDTAAYIDGGHSDTHFYAFGLGGMGGNDDAWRMQMSNESGTAMNNTMGQSKDDLGCFMDYHHGGGKIYTMSGGNSTVDMYDMTTHSRSGANGSPSGGTYGSSAQGRLRGWSSHDSTKYYYVFSTDTWNSWTGTVPGTDGWGKANSSYMGNFYMKNGGNCTTEVCKHDDYTGVQRSVYNVAYSGEENYQMGNFKGYCLGEYNGNQNNNSYKMSYTSDTYSVGSQTMEPKGHGGMSSAACASASNFVNTAYGVTPPSY